MDVEKTNINLLSYLLKKVDKKKQGACLDIGVGTSNFYCERFAQLGYFTIAIEPLPSDELKKLCEINKIELVEAAIGDIDGEINIYSGIFKNENLRDVSSVFKDWWGVNAQSKCIKVKAHTLRKVCNEFNIKMISYLKVDTEGSEFSILSQTPGLKSNVSPKIIEFEYGGGNNKATKLGGWNDRFYSNTIKILNLLETLGYKYGIIVERENESIKQFSNEGEKDLIFENHFVYGNLLLSKTNIFTAHELNKLSKQEKRASAIKIILEKFKGR